LAKEGLLFSQLYATGTRTVRGLEAITLSVPPTPGQSIVRRPGNDNLFSLGFVFKDRGYDTKFIYGGYGYFDNMSAFFSTNGFDVVDRTSMTKPEINFANVWGVADDDMFARALKEADASYAAGKPFMHLIMTTSNHRPYTYPEGRIDIPSKSGRAGGVKYADYSVGKLVEWAQKKPWFKDTVFVFLADHTAGAGGKAELDPKKYHIPMIFYAPELIGKGRYDKIASQIDFAPTLLGWLNFSYRSKFYGEDLMQKHDNAQRAFISNYQKVALAKNGKITVLAPKRKIEQFGWPQEDPLAKEDPELISDAIGYYQSASWWHETQKRINTKVQ
jgi:phosphoglycerol transferase MdoB-like AlkP superfamily enzyme